MNRANGLAAYRHELPVPLRHVLLAHEEEVPAEYAVTWLRDLLDQHVDRGSGLVILTGLAGESADQLGRACLRLSALAGDVIAQDASGTMLRQVADRGSQIGEGRSARYADSRFGGSLHTDGAEAPFPVPDYFALLCVRQAEHGGALRLVHVDQIIDRLSDTPGVLDVLRSPFYFDRRGDQRRCEPPVTAKPVLFPDGDGTGVTYLREYIELGHRHPEVSPLSEDQVRALDALDDVLADPHVGILGKQCPNELALFNNKRILHGRTTFEDVADPVGKRLLFRTWIRRGA